MKLFTIKSLLLVSIISFSAFAYSKCLNSYQDITKFSGASNDCTGFFVGPDLFLTAKHCLLQYKGKLVMRLGPIGGTYPENVFNWGVPIFQSPTSDIALVKVEKKHPYLTDEDFKCIELSRDLFTRKNEYKFIVGAARGPIAMPLVYKCVDPYLENDAITCKSMGNPGQSGSALVGYNIETDRIYVYGAFVGGLGVDVRKEFYINASKVVAIDEVMDFMEQELKLTPTK